MQINANYNFHDELSIEEIEELFSFFRNPEDAIETAEIEQLVAGIAQLKLSDTHEERSKKLDLAKKKITNLSPIQKPKHTPRKETQAKKAIYERMLRDLPLSATSPNIKKPMEVEALSTTNESSSKENPEAKPKKLDLVKKKIANLSPIQKPKHTPRKEAQAKKSAYERILRDLPLSVISPNVIKPMEVEAHATNNDSLSKENPVTKPKKLDLAKKKIANLSPIQKPKHTPRKEAQAKKSVYEQMLRDLPLTALHPITQETAVSPKPKKQVRWETIASHKMTFANGVHFTQCIPVVDESSSKENRDPATKEEAEALFEAGCRDIQKWKQSPEAKHPVGRKLLGERIDRSLTEKAMTQRHISLIVLECLLAKARAAQSQ